MEKDEIKNLFTEIDVFEFREKSENQCQQFLEPLEHRVSDTEIKLKDFSMRSFFAMGLVSD